MRKSNLLAVLAILPLILVSAYQRPDQTVVSDLSPEAFATLFKWTKYNRNPMVAGRSSPGFDQAVADPTVIYDTDGYYKMRYIASGYAYGDRIPRSRIGYATSSDGRTWTRGTGPVLATGAAGSWDAYALQTPWVLKVSENPPLYHMYYQGYSSVNAQKQPRDGQIGLATSVDGVNWQKSPQNPILTIDKSYATNRWSSFGLWGPVVIKDGGLFKMWYLGVGADTSFTQMVWGIGYATSRDGIRWARNPEPVLYTGPGSYFKRLSDLSVLKIGSTYYLWLTANKKDNNNYEIWQASSNDGIAWQVDAQSPVVPRGRAGSWDSFCTMAPSVLQVGNELWMWYHGDSVADPYYIKIGFATAPIPTP